jgi:hypothetical protein
VTFLWLIVFVLATLIGGGESLELTPVNAWTVTLILSVAVDLNRPRPELGRG